MGSQKSVSLLQGPAVDRTSPSAGAHGAHWQQNYCHQLAGENQSLRARVKVAGAWCLSLLAAKSACLSCRLLAEATRVGCVNHCVNGHEPMPGINTSRCSRTYQPSTVAAASARHPAATGHVWCSGPLTATLHPHSGILPRWVVEDDVVDGTDRRAVGGFVFMRVPPPGRAGTNVDAVPGCRAAPCIVVL
jgi:hypothetical protein